MPGLAVWQSSAMGAVRFRAAGASPVGAARRAGRAEPRRGAEDFDVIALCGAGEDADEDLTQPRRGSEQEAPLESPGGNLDQGAVGNEAQTAAHATINGKAPGKLASLHLGNACGSASRRRYPMD